MSFIGFDRVESLENLKVSLSLRMLKKLFPSPISSRNYQRSMRKLDLAQRRGSNRHKVNDPVVSHYDRKTSYALPKIRLDAITKKRTQIEYTSDFETKCVMIIIYGLCLRLSSTPSTSIQPKISFLDSIWWNMITQDSGICKSI